MFPRSSISTVYSVRSVLAFSNSLCLIFFARRLRDVFHVRLSRQFLILTCCQFHIMFWIGRTVPNMLVFGPGAPNVHSSNHCWAHRLTILRPSSPSCDSLYAATQTAHNKKMVTSGCPAGSVSIDRSSSHNAPRAARSHGTTGRSSMDVRQSRLARGQLRHYLDSHIMCK